MPTPEQINKARAAVHEARTKAVDNLRRSGMFVRYQAGENTVNVVADSISVTYDQDVVRVEIDGMDVTDKISSVNIALRPRDYPAFTITFRHTPIFINAED